MNIFPVRPVPPRIQVKLCHKCQQPIGIVAECMHEHGSRVVAGTPPTTERFDRYYHLECYPPS